MGVIMENCRGTRSCPRRCLSTSPPIEIVDDVAEIVEAFLMSPYHDGIPMGEFRIMTQEDIDAYVEPPAIVPRVWTSLLPR